MAMIVSGCGTIMTRGGDVTFGKYPYQAVVNDVTVWIPESFDQPGHPVAEGVDLATAIVSVPIDIVADTVLLPVDVGYWIAEKKKDNKGPRLHLD
ncbi:MAG: hypothetical protein WCG22_04440 [Lentisphaerota bacterium]